MSKHLRFTLLVLCLALGAGLSVAMGQDASWDLRNYHLYNPFALLNGRFNLDFFAADKQTTNNPLLDVPYAFLALGPLASYPRFLAALMGLWYGLLVFMTWSLVDLLFAPFKTSERRILLPVCTLTAVTGAMSVALIGSTSDDIPVGALIVTGLSLILHRAVGREKMDRRLLGGILFGLAAGFKLTGGIYAPALVLALFVGLAWREAIVSSILFSLGWLAGFAVSFGWWGWNLWRHLGNPVFPLFNTLFKSPFAPQHNNLDLRFFPKDVWQWIAYPFYWAFNADAHPVFEGLFRDPRMALAYTALMIWGAAAAKTRIVRTAPADNNLALTPPQKIVSAFLVFSYLSWLATTSILRYAIPLEILSVAVAFFLIMKVASLVNDRRFRHEPVVLVVVASLFCLSITRYPVWERRPFQDKMFHVDMSWVQPHTMFLSFTAPAAYLAAFVPPDLQARFVDLLSIKYYESTPLGAEGRRLIRNHQGPYVLLFSFEEGRDLSKTLPEGFGLRLSLLSEAGLLPEVKNCRTISADLSAPETQPLFACEVTRAM